jgi:anti-sigma factor RsiW
MTKNRKDVGSTEGSNEAENDVEALLPWYVAGTASEAQRREVDHALAADPTLRVQIELIGEEMHAARIANEQAGHAPANALVRLMETIEKTSPRSDKTANGRAGMKSPTRFLGGFLDWLGRPSVLAPFALAGLLLLLGQAAFIASLLERRDPAHYATAASGANAATGTTAILAFTADATSAEIDALLVREHLRIVDGPMPGGLYNVQLSNSVLPPAERDAVLAKLRSETKLVRLALPSPT